jgi:hypothetical protein
MTIALMGMRERKGKLLRPDNAPWSKHISDTEKVERKSAYHGNADANSESIGSSPS